MEIVKAEFRDLEEVLTLQRLCFQSEAEFYQDFTIPSLTQDLAGIQNEFKTAIILKMVQSSIIIGSVRAKEKEGICYVGSLSVHPEHQNKGLGATLMLEIESFFPQVQAFELFTGGKSTKNLNLYQKLGYQEYKREPVKHYELAYMKKPVG